MKNSLKCVFVSAVFILFSFSLNALAEMRPGAFTLSPAVGGYVFDNNEDIDSAMVYGLGLGYNFTKNWGVEGTFDYVDTESELAEEEDVKAQVYRLDGLYHFMTDKKLVPYLAAGAGSIHLDRDTGRDETDPLINYGGGIKYFVTDSIALRGDVRHIITDDSNDNLIYTVGLTVLFGGEATKEPAPLPVDKPKDTGGDGVYDETDRCPDTPQGVAVDKAGCPLDSDKDGVYDYLDKCPGTPQGVKVDNDGCPMDTDRDGVYDEMDRCPDTPQGVKVDRNGCPGDADGDGVYDEMDRCPDTPKGASVDKSGCPLDSDKDGVYDYLDKCPGTPIGVKVDENGCPPPVKEKVSVDLKVEFDTGSATVKEIYKDNIKKAADFLKEYPGTTAVIEGHTDNIGSDKSNLQLSEKRAQSVKDYIVKQFDVDPSRIAAKGYGETVPVADNNTKDGRQKNRRVIAVMSTEK